MSFVEALDDAHQNNRIAAAMSLAQQAIENPHNISNFDFQELKTLFTIEEL